MGLKSVTHRPPVRHHSRVDRSRIGPARRISVHDPDNVVFSIWAECPDFDLARALLSGHVLSPCSFNGLGIPWSLTGNITTLQDSLHGTDCRFAPPSQRDTPLQHLQSPGSTGRLLRGSLVITATGLAPASQWQLARHTKWHAIRKRRLYTNIRPICKPHKIYNK